MVRKDLTLSTFFFGLVIFLLCLSLSSCRKPKATVETIESDDPTPKTTPTLQNHGPYSLVDPAITKEPNQRTWKDVAYADLSPSQKLDIYLPEKGQGPFPVIISIHGGGLVEGDKVGLDLKAALHGLQRDYAVISINYRLLGELGIPAQIQDVKAAIRFVRANGLTYNVNPMKIALWGGSAGGYLASLAGTSSDFVDFIDPTLGNEKQSDKVQAVVDWYGPIRNLSVMGVKSSYFSNPETFVTKDDPPFLIQHGKQDQLVSFEQSVAFAEKLKKVVGEKRVELTLFENAQHADPLFFSPENINKVLDFLDKYMK
jgi:acetyl esterase/lipase